MICSFGGGFEMLRDGGNEDVILQIIRDYLRYVCQALN